MISTFDNGNFNLLCTNLAKKDNDLKTIIQLYGLPPLWQRKPSFETLVHIILEQQVSLASAKAALEKLKTKIGTISPAKLLSLSDQEMRSCYFSRQKTLYVRHLAESVITKSIFIPKLTSLSDDDVRISLKRIKGIGDWTADVFLMMALNRTDCFPIGDVALINSIKKVKELQSNCSKEEILSVAERWKPYRTIAAYLLWHNYLSKRIKPR